MSNTNTITNQNSTHKTPRYKFQCTLFGTKLCKHPECSGYDDRKCDTWKTHSSK